MTDIRKKVARAINDANFGYVSDPETFVPSENELFIADAALSACGHAELIAALTLLLDNCPIRDDDFEVARSALIKAGVKAA